MPFLVQIKSTFFCDNYFLSIFTFSAYNRMLVYILVQSLRPNCSECNYACTASKKSESIQVLPRKTFGTSFSIGLGMCN